MSARGEQLAILADIHGNRWALEAVLADARAAGVSRFVDLGDSVAGPLDPGGTVELLRGLDAVCVSGNNDRAVLEAAASPSAAFARRQLDSAQLEWLARLPATARVGEDVLACHGSPTDDCCYLLEEVTELGLRRRAPEEVARLLGPIRSGIVLCGHTHLPRTLPLPAGALVVNPGSVGCPAFADHAPHPHVVESGAPHARYGLLRRRGASWEVELRAVTYPWRLAAARAREGNREDWAVALETGLAPSTVLRTSA